MQTRPEDHINMASRPSDLKITDMRTATENFIALEHHFTDVPFWADFVDGLPKPLIQDGTIPVPETPGLGFTLNEEAVRAHLLPESPDYFAPTPQWDTERSWDRLWS